MRRQGARLVQRYVKLQPTIGQAVEREWRALFGGHTGGVLGLHIRGTDVMETDAIFSARRRLVTAAYAPFVDGYLAAHPAAKLFLATDDEAYAQTILGAWPCRDRVAVRSVRRPKKGFRAHCGSENSAASRSGALLDVLIDILLLSRCDCLLIGASVHT